MLMRLLEITVPVFGVVVLAYFYGRLRPTDMGPANRLNLVLFIPALIFHALTERTNGDLALVDAAFAAAVIVLASGALIWPLARLLRAQPRTLVPPTMFNNCGNMGLPLAVFAFGEQALPVAVVFLVTTTVLQFTIGLWIVTGRLDILGLLRHPLLLATAAGIVAMACDWHAPAMIQPAIAMLADVAIPLMLVALGLRLSEGRLGDWRIGFIGGLATPATGLLVALPWLWLTHPPALLAGLIVLYAALPPAVMNYMLAEHAGQEPERAASIVAVGNAMALVIIPITLWFVL